MVKGYTIEVKVNGTTVQAGSAEFDQNAKDVRTITLAFPMLLRKNDRINVKLTEIEAGPYTVKENSYLSVRRQPHF